MRFTAALAVFVSHFVLLHFDGGLLWQLQPYGSEAVDVFFVLSGFLIAYTADQRDRSAANFAVNRAARIYSVALPAVLATMALDEVGRTVNPAAYADLPQYVSGQELRQTLLGLAFLNQNWTLATPVGTNVPYWSLGNEVWYYTIFGIAFYGVGRYRVIGVLFALLAAGPRILLLFPLWLLGVACWRLSLSGPPSIPVQRTLFIGSAALWLAYETWASRHGRLTLPLQWALDRPQVVQDYMIGLLFAANLLGAGAVSPLLKRLSVLAAGRAIRWLASATFTLYLFHFPVMQFLRAVEPWPPESIASRGLLFSGTLLIVFAISTITERRKERWRGMFAAVMVAVLPRTRVALPPR
ncbi:MAG: acyltransferase [Acetobacteraceae bacterium]|nr:acyltransferase [Acetobacteraceae bacterium]